MRRQQRSQSTQPKPDTGEADSGQLQHNACNHSHQPNHICAVAHGDKIQHCHRQHILSYHISEIIIAFTAGKCNATVSEFTKCSQLDEEALTVTIVKILRTKGKKGVAIYSALVYDSVMR